MLAQIPADGLPQEPPLSQSSLRGSNTLRRGLEGEGALMEAGLGPPYYLYMILER